MAFAMNMLCRPRWLELAAQVVLTHTADAQGMRLALGLRPLPQTWNGPRAGPPFRSKWAALGAWRAHFSKNGFLDMGASCRFEPPFLDRNVQACNDLIE